jgi:hypothetical protein
MSTIYDDPCPPPSDEDETAFCELVADFEIAVHRRFGHERAEVLLDDWHVTAVVYAISARFERGKAHRILSDLNEQYRFEQFIDHVEWYDTEGGFRPWVLVPVPEP